jgi:Ni/Co efflux regulator RcnB
MNIKAFFSALMAVCLLATAPAFARDDDRHDRRGDRHEQRSDRHEQRSDRHHDRHRKEQARNHDRHDRNQYRNHGPNHGPAYAGRGAGPRHDMRRGGRLSREYRGRQYVVNNWRQHRLSAPPRGYHWVRTGGDFVLVGSTSGMIFQIFLN